jgi:hypothetical protein
MWLEYRRRESNEARSSSHGEDKGGFSGLRENTTWAPNGNLGAR